MPRTKLDRFHAEQVAAQRQERMIALCNKTIDHGMIDRGIKTLDDLAVLIAMPVSTLYNKRKTGNWKMPELILLRDALGLTPEQSLGLIGGQNRREK